MDDSEKTIDVVIQATKLTVDIFQNVIYDLTTKRNYESRGNVRLGQLMKQGKLDSIEITDNNIKSFLDVAKKYDVSYALKRDSSTSPPTYHVFFSAAKTEDFKRAFSEYVGKGQGKTQKRGEFTREQMQQQAQKLRSKPRKQKQREKTRENRR